MSGLLGRSLLAASCFAAAAAAAPAAFASNLIADPGFESGTSGFTTPSAGDSATRSTSNPIDGAASLAVSLKSLGSELVWTQSPPSATSASQLVVSARIRPDSMGNWTTLQLCAEAVYSNELGAVQKCVPVPSVPSTVYLLSSALVLDSTKTLASLSFQVVLRSATPVTFTIDDVSAEIAPPTNSR